jgi:hypothetical protein
MTSSRSFVALAALVLSLGARGASAEGIGPCVADAARDYRECKGVCREDFQLTKDTCANRDHACVESCRADRQTCLQPVLATLNGTLATIQASLDAARANCRTLYADGTPERDTCIDNAQVDAFQQRDAAREVAAPGIKACRRAFKTCVRTNCPPLTVPDPPVVHACKADARDVFEGCVADCLEGKQLAKDTCLNRDHACVETCRSTRTGCRQPFVDTLNGLLAQCAAARATAIDQCPPPGSPNRDSCVDQVQVIAFQCRDSARETVSGDLAACRQAFQTCAQACPPPGQ